MIESSENDCLESVIALNMALGGNLEKDLTEQESERNISRNLVGVYAINEITSQFPFPFSFNGQGGSGLMITTNGFIVTAYHNIQGVEDDWERINEEDPITQENVDSWTSRMRDRYCVMDQEENRYPIDTSFWAINQDKDIALIKAVTNKRPEPIKFRVVKEPLQVGDGVKLLGLRDHKPYNQYGRVIYENCDQQINDHNGQAQSVTYDTFLTDAYGVPGFSGGVFTDIRGGFAGLALYIQGNGTREIGKAGGAKAKSIAQLVKGAAYNLGKTQLSVKR
ncbi:trypsin-like peptidase domain-containing protein [Nanoarchaeota archaeon]